MTWEMNELARLSFPGADLPAALRAVLVPSGLPLREAALPPVEARRRASWLREAPKVLGLDASFAERDLGEMLDVLRRPEPMLILVSTKATDRVVAVLGGRTCRVQLESGTEHRLPPRRLLDLLVRAGASDTRLADLLGGVPDAARIVDQLAARGGLGLRTFFVTTFRLDAAHGIWAQARREGALGRAVGFVTLSMTRLAFTALATAWMGASALAGHVELTQIVGWTLLVAADVPLGYLTRLLYGRLSSNLAGALKRRILEGAFHADPIEVSTTGLGRILARATEASAVEQGGVGELGSAAVVVGYWLGAGALVVSGPLRGVTVPLFVLVSLVLAALVVRQTRMHLEEYELRSDLTDGLVERLLGHRTRLLQRRASNVHAGEDAMLDDLGRVSGRRDRTLVLAALLPRAWQVLGFGVLGAAFVWHAPSLVVLGLAVIAGQAAYAGAHASALQWAPWLTAWRALRPLVEGGRTRDRSWRPVPEHVADEGRRPTALTLSRVSFAHRAGGRNVLDEVSLQVLEGERVLLQGPSGGGKSTLASVLASERRATSGSVLVRGLDVGSVPKAEWRTRVAYAPQFHENYVFSNTFGFNLDPRADGEVTAEALAVCEELGLDRVLERMPSGTAQLLGETGWQLSHGEKSRLYIARALLQGAEIVIFDESFGALDPETLMTVMKCVRKRAKTLLVIAHP